MGPFRTANIESRQIVKNLNPKIADSETLDVSDDKMLGDTVPCEEDTVFNNDVFDTQVMDDDAVAETQPMDFDDEMQIMDLAGETQVLDDYDFEDHMDTQQLDVSNNEVCDCKSDNISSESTEILDDSVDSKFQDKSGIETTPSREEGTSHFCQVNGGTRSESLPLGDVAWSSGSLRRGFASVRTASLRAAGLAARQSALKDANNGSSSTVFSSVASDSRSDDGGRASNVETVGVLNNMEKINDEGLVDEDKCNVFSSLARKLFLEEDVADLESDDNISERREHMFQLPSSDNNVAGLSYVNSQEPGELSQANALDFVDRFLKVSVFESDLGVKPNNPVAEIASPSATAKGAQRIAQQASRKSTLAGASIFEWDDNLEDEGGGEFFTKKKEVLLGSINRTHNHKPRGSRCCELRGSQSVGKLQKGKGKRNSHHTMNGFFHSESKLVKGGEKVEVKKIGIEKNVDNGTGQQSALSSCTQEALAEVHNAQSVDTENIGIDTQMAAEAMEALSTENLYVNIDCSISDQARQSERNFGQIEATNIGLAKHSKQSSLKKRAWDSTSGVVTRSRSKSNVKSRRHSVMRKFDSVLVNPSPKRSRLSINDFSPLYRREPDKIPVCVSGKQTKSNLGHLDHNSVPSLKRRSLRQKATTPTPVVHKAAECIEHHSHGAEDESGNSGERYFLEVIPERKHRTKNNVLSENSNHRIETLDQTTVAKFEKIDGSNSKRGGTDNAISKDNKSRSKGTLSAYGGPVFTIDSISRRTRSKKNTIQCADECPRDKRGIHSSGIIVPKDACQLFSKNNVGCSPPAKGTLESVTTGGSAGNVKSPANSADSTPVNSETPGNAVSPICVGDGYYSPACKKSLSLKKEFMSLVANEDRSSSPFKGLRQRRYIKNVCVLFSQHLDDDTVRQQKKILSRLGVSMASSISEATHFVADMFVRTRNMLEAIASAKPVVTHLWLESCGQANCFIDEKSYILRDASKEKELGFSMPKSLAHASQQPLLESKKVLITPNVKPGKEVISSLVKTVHGQAVERLGRSTANDELFVLSCEEDFGVCVPLLEKGIAVYSSELLLNGIITQRLEYERYRLFTGHVKKTRSTLWLNKSGGKFLPVIKTK
ncbi:PAX-interacting protein 1 [Bienertia sinuspersici]